MKKKLLSLVLAGAMVASTSVSAFAATPTTTQGNTTIQEGKDDQEVPVEITGNVLDNKGNAKPGTINVSVPTATSFSVNATTGDLVSADMVITNNSDEKIKVIASRFEDSNGEDEINVMKRSEFERDGHTENDNERGNIWLRLRGGTKSIDFTSEDNGTMYDIDGVKKVETDNYVISEVNGQGELRLRLEGKGGITPGDKTPSEKAIQDNFKLVLKIARVK